MSMFNLQRFFSLIKRDWILHKKQFFTIAIILMAYCIFLMLMGKDSQAATLLDFNEHVTYLPEIILLNMLGLIGCFVTLLIFKELRKPEDRLNFLQLPASHFEKFLSKWIYSFPGFWILTGLVFSLTYNIFGSLMESYTDTIYTSLSYINFSRIKVAFMIYAVVHSALFILGIIFNRFVIPKSIMTILIIFFITIGIGILIIRLVMFDYFNGWFLRGGNFNVNVSFQDNAKWFFTHSHYIALCLLAPFFWVVSYLKITEKEL